jgi:NAD(P)-dependent dehydrogenase (short-subunit alcohol dehydrogenase family)
VTEGDGASRLSGQVAIVTGGARGLGLATARHLASRGVTCILADLDGEKLEQASAAMQRDGLSGHPHQADLTNEDQVRDLAASTIEQHGRVDILVNLAGIYPTVPFADLTLEQWRAVIQATLDTTFLCCHQVLPHMQKQGYGRIVNTSSSTFHSAIPGLSAYVASKGGILGFTRVLAREVGPSGITANVIMPGLIQTEHALASAPDFVWDKHIEDQCVKRRGEPADIATAIEFLVSPDASFISGQTLNVDGGISFN